MTTLIASYDSDGCTGRCDARCYDAQHTECDCICGGMNHGKGLQEALDNTRELAETWIEDAERQTGRHYEWVVDQSVYQLALPLGVMP